MVRVGLTCAQRQRRRPQRRKRATPPFFFSPLYSGVCVNFLCCFGGTTAQPAHAHQTVVVIFRSGFSTISAANSLEIIAQRTLDRYKVFDRALLFCQYVCLYQQYA